MTVLPVVTGFLYRLRTQAIIRQRSIDSLTSLDAYATAAAVVTSENQFHCTRLCVTDTIAFNICDIRLQLRLVFELN